MTSSCGEQTSPSSIRPRRSAGQRRLPALGQVTSGTKYFYDGTPVPGQQFGYNFDTIGNRTQTKAGGDQTGGNQRLANYWANNLNQITNRDYPGTNDIIGVVLATNSVTVNGQSAWHKWEYFRGTVQTNNAVAPAWLTAIVGSGGTTNTGSLFMPQTPEHFAYDADGNLTNDGRWAYTWDAENRLIGMAANTSVGPQYQLAFAYDAKGRRIQKIGANSMTVTTNNFLYDGWNLVAELQPNNTPIRTYVWGIDLSGSIQGAGGVGGLLEVSYYGASVTNCFAAFDGNGNLATLVSSADGTAAANYEYGPFGEVIRATGPMAKANPIRFSTKFDDDESDLLYYGYRYCKPSTGTWLARDPAGEALSQNLFCFSENDAINKVDFLGDYAIDFHYYAVYYLVRAKCYSSTDANTVATSSQAVDDDPATDPIILGLETTLGSETAAQTLEAFHFYGSTPNTPTHRNPPILRGLAILGFLDGDLNFAGARLHSYADSWAHEGFTAWCSKAINYRTGSARGYAANFVGHVDAAEGGHAPDNPYNDVPKAVEAAMSIYDLIPVKSCCNGPTRATVESDMEEAFAYHNPNDHIRADNFRSLIQRRFGESPQYRNPF